jgi:hypothetical protein
MKYDVCPRCNSKWSSPKENRFNTDYLCCGGECGMLLQVYSDNAYIYSLTLGDYWIGWGYNMGNKHTCCTIEYDGSNCNLSEQLPFDVSKDMIRIALVFS